MPKSNTINSWLRLLRAPNLLTVPGDAAAGCTLAALWLGQPPPLGFMILAGLCVTLFYCYGLILNDVVDVRADRKNRSGRPLAEGDIPVIAALVIGLALGLFGLVLAVLFGNPAFVTLSVVLLFVITAYNLLLKRFSIPGSVGMGLCRGISVMVGAVTLPRGLALPLVAAIGLAAFIGFVTWIADHEEDFYDFDRKAFLPFYGYAGACLIPLLMVTIHAPDKRLLACMVALILGLARVIYLSTRLSKGAIPPGVTQRSIGAFLRALIPLQASFFLMGMGMLAKGLGLGLLILIWPAARVISHRFYAS